MWQKCNPSANYCGFQCWAINKCQCANHSTKHHWYALSEPKVHSCTLADSPTQSFIPCLGLSTLIDCWWLETCCLVWRVLFSILSSEWTCTGIGTTSWIHEPWMSAGDSSSWWRICTDGGVCSLSDMTLTGDTYICILADHLHCAFWQTWVIPAVQCNSPHVQNCYRVASGILFWV